MLNFIDEIRFFPSVIFHIGMMGHRDRVVLFCSWIYVIKFVRNFRYVSGFPRVLRFPALLFIRVKITLSVLSLTSEAEYR